MTDEEDDTEDRGSPIGPMPKSMPDPITAVERAFKADRSLVGMLDLSHVERTISLLHKRDPLHDLQKAVLRDVGISASAFARSQLSVVQVERQYEQLRRSIYSIGELSRLQLAPIQQIKDSLASKAAMMGSLDVDIARIARSSAAYKHSGLLGVLSVNAIDSSRYVSGLAATFGHGLAGDAALIPISRGLFDVGAALEQLNAGRWPAIASPVDGPISVITSHEDRTLLARIAGPPGETSAIMAELVRFHDADAPSASIDVEMPCLTCGETVVFRQQGLTFRGSAPSFLGLRQVPLCETCLTSPHLAALFAVIKTSPAGAMLVDGQSATSGAPMMHIVQRQPQDVLQEVAALREQLAELQADHDERWIAMHRVFTDLTAEVRTLKTGDGDALRRIEAQVEVLFLALANEMLTPRLRALPQGERAGIVIGLLTSVFGG